MRYQDQKIFPLTRFVARLMVQKNKVIRYINFGLLAAIALVYLIMGFLGVIALGYELIMLAALAFAVYGGFFSKSTRVLKFAYLVSTMLYLNFAMLNMLLFGMVSLRWLTYLAWALVSAYGFLTVSYRHLIKADLRDDG